MGYGPSRAGRRFRTNQDLGGSFAGRVGCRCTLNRGGRNSPRGQADTRRGDISSHCGADHTTCMRDLNSCLPNLEAQPSLALDQVFPGEAFCNVRRTIFRGRSGISGLQDIFGCSRRRFNPVLHLRAYIRSAAPGLGGLIHFRPPRQNLSLIDLPHHVIFIPDGR